MEKSRVRSRRLRKCSLVKMNLELFVKKIIEKWWFSDQKIEIKVWVVLESSCIQIVISKHWNRQQIEDCKETNSSGQNRAAFLVNNQKKMLPDSPMAICFLNTQLVFPLLKTIVIFTIFERKFLQENQATLFLVNYQKMLPVSSFFICSFK